MPKLDWHLGYNGDTTYILYWDRYPYFCHLRYTASANYGYYRSTVGIQHKAVNPVVKHQDPYHAFRLSMIQLAREQAKADKTKQAKELINLIK